MVTEARIWTAVVARDPNSTFQILAAVCDDADGQPVLIKNGRPGHPAPYAFLGVTQPQTDAVMGDFTATPLILQR
jgi:hypothetical protein